jgi:hypothetical protein
LNYIPEKAIKNRRADHRPLENDFQSALLMSYLHHAAINSEIHDLLLVEHSSSLFVPCFPSPLALKSETKSSLRGLLLSVFSFLHGALLAADVLHGILVPASVMCFEAGNYFFQIWCISRTNFILTRQVGE